MRPTTFLDCWHKRDGIYYLVHWEAHPTPSWEPAKSGCQHSLEEFHKQVPYDEGVHSVPSVNRHRLSNQCLALRCLRVSNPVPCPPHTCQNYLSARLVLRAERVARRLLRAGAPPPSHMNTIRQMVDGESASAPSQAEALRLRSRNVPRTSLTRRCPKDPSSSSRRGGAMALIRGSRPVVTSDGGDCEKIPLNSQRKGVW
ncbi:hypothetical protein Efla_000729 [Eimeria flavescens]